MTTSGYTLLDVPRPRQTLVHVHPGAEELGRVYQAELPILSGMAQFAAAVARPARRAALARVDARRRAPTTRRGSSTSPMPGGVDLGDVHRAPARARARRDRHERRRQPHRLDPPLLALPRLPDASSRRRAARWATACPRRSPRRRSRPERTVVCFSGDGDFLMSRPGARDRGAVRPADRRPRRRQRHVRDDPHAPGAPVPGPRRRHRSRQPDFAALRARLRRARRDRRAHGRVRRRRSSARSPPACRPSLALRIDPEAITPRTTLSAIRAGADERTAGDPRSPGSPSRSATTPTRSAPATCSSSRAASRSTATGNLVAGDVVAQARQVFANIARGARRRGRGLRRRRQGDGVPHRHRRPRGGEHGAAGGLRRDAAREHARRGEPARDPGRPHRGRGRRAACRERSVQRDHHDVEPAAALPGPLHGRAPARQGPDRHRRRSARRTARGSTPTTSRRAPRPRSSGSSPPAPSSSARRTCTSSRGA